MEAEVVEDGIVDEKIAGDGGDFSLLELVVNLLEDEVDGLVEVGGDNGVADEGVAGGKDGQVAL